MAGSVPPGCCGPGSLTAPGEHDVDDGMGLERLAPWLDMGAPAEETGRLGITIDPGWEERYSALGEEQRARSRG